MVRSLDRLAHSSVKTSASTIRHQLTGTKSDGEGALCREYLLSSHPESAHAHSSLVSTVTRAPSDTKVHVDSDPIMVRAGTALPGAIEGGSGAMLSSTSTAELLQKRKKDKK